MKGIIFNLLAEVVTHHHGENTWDLLLADTQLSGAYTSLGNYPDDELSRLVGAASARLNLPPQTIIRWFGQEAIPLLAKKYDGFFSKHVSTRSFILTINGIIHPEVRKLYPGADVPDFDLDASSPDRIVMGYHSKRKLCALAEGLIHGAAGHYGETAKITHDSCMHRGDPCCVLAISFEKSAAPRSLGRSSAREDQRVLKEGRSETCPTAEKALGLTSPFSRTPPPHPCFTADRVTADHAHPASERKPQGFRRPKDGN